MLAIAKDFSPRIMRVAPGEVVLDVGGLGRLIGEPEAIARELRRAVIEAAVTATVAVAPTQTMARLLARARPDHRQPPDSPTAPSAGIALLPITLLRDLETVPPGMSARDRDRPYETLERWGVPTLAALAALPAAELSTRLGRRGVAMHRLARGLDPRPFVPDADVPRFIERLELEWPVHGLEPLSFVLARLLDPLCAALERAGRGAAAIHLELRLTDRSTHARRLQLPAPLRDPRVLRTLLLLDLESRPPSPADAGSEVTASEVRIDIVAIEIDPAPSRITQFSLLERAVPSAETLSTLTARLSALVGESHVGSAVLLDTHRPDAFEMRRFAAGAAEPAGAPAASAPAGLVLRRQRLPLAIRVNVSNGRPVYLAPSRRGIPSGAIIQYAGPWRHSGGWWSVASGCPPRDRSSLWDRNEWDVALTSGAVCRIFQDRVTERWFLEGTYD